ncbi:unannotated protein [freshwater metagenome]|uniref:Unannotated protein n=1 Tax=freshwater metagenome TaxID=449393 RepID=A0A6J7D567_9ZZZZ|nr:TetR family transcriptional regulator [Actinomycetota bacterium]
MSTSRQGRKRGVRAEVPITQEAIIDAAFRLIDERGGDAFSMRAVAADLGVFPATLYWHVGDRARLLGLVEASWASAVQIPEEIADWREWCHELARRYRARAHQHPNVARLVIVERARNIASLVLPDAVVGRLAELGLGDDLVHAYNSLVGAVQGFVVLELALIPDPEAASMLEAEAELRSLDPASFPNITRHFDALADRALSVRWTDGAKAPLDASFEFLIDLLLDGLDARLRASAPNKTPAKSAKTPAKKTAPAKKAAKTASA